MSYRHLRMICECGQVPARILEIGFTAGHELVVHFWCSKCSRVLVVSKPLTECWRECPQPPSARVPVKTRAALPGGAIPTTAVPTMTVPTAAVPTAEDNQFLQSIGVTFLEAEAESR